MLRSLILSFVLLSLFAAEGKAYSGLELLRDCNELLNMADGRQPTVAIRAGTCAGYVGGIVDGSTFTASVLGKGGALYCLPPAGLQNEQIVYVVLKYLKANPDKLHQPARLSALLALRSAFPC